MADNLPPGTTQEDVESRERRCACVADDAYECMRFRYQGQPTPLEEEPCECTCHDNWWGDW